jgi:hypothetical protein
VIKANGWSILLHGYGSGDEYDDLCRRVAEGSYPNVLLDHRYFDLPEKAESVCEQADVGLAWYHSALSPNFDTAALSSGKIPVYLKHGLPIVIRKFGSFVEVLERSGCAVAIESPEQLPLALSHIENNYCQMSECAIATFKDRYDFGRYEAALDKFITSRVTALR